MAKKKATRNESGQVPKPAKKSTTKKKTSNKLKVAIAVLPPADAQLNFPVVGIGASAGGLEAMVELLENMPSNSGMAFVIVTHQHPGHASLLPELLARKTALPVGEVEDGQAVQPNHVYVMPPGGQLAILGGTLQRMETEQPAAPKLPIDYFFRSLAEDQLERAVVIILSGTGTDGTLGLRAIKAGAGMAMVESPESAKYPGMPSSAIATGMADYVLPPAAMPEQLLNYVKGPYLQGTATAAESPSVPAGPMQKIFVLLRSQTGHDFSCYKTNTLRRRIERRMNIHQIKNPNDYVKYLHENVHEIDLLFKELLISVTSFFRDRQAWVSLNTHVEELLGSQSGGGEVRAWVPGCATGEEVYSLAILLREGVTKLRHHINAQVFGTDLDGNAIETARAGRYPEGVAVDVSAEYLEHYFTHHDNSYRIRKEVREMAVFAQQNVVKDPPFTKLDIIACRNLLIYLDADLQKMLLPIFHYALKPGGLLFLGPSESIGALTDLFEPLDKRWKIFRRKDKAGAVHSLPRLPTHRATLDAQTATSMQHVTDTPVASARTVPALIERILVTQFAPASVVVSDRGDIVYIHGRTGMYLEPAPGQPRANILEMAREGLPIALAAALRQCNSTGGEVVREGVRVKTNGDYSLVNVTVSKLGEPESLRGLLLVTFRPVEIDATRERAKPTKQKNRAEGEQVVELERELRYTKESHQSTIEELQLSNEELKSTNEELQSTNEELQSTNEELETSKEEMQSLNEELTTVNSELQCKVDELSQATDDMQNLLNSTDIATLFLDNELNINRFTEQTQNLIKLRDTDVGRPLSELVSNLPEVNLEDDCRRVLRALSALEREVADKDGIWYLMRIKPYRTAENLIEGLVITFVNIQRLKTAEESAELRAFFESIVETLREPLLVLDDQHRIVSANTRFCERFRLDRKQVVGALLSKVGQGEWDIPQLNHLLDEILPEHRTLEDFKVTHEFSKVGRKTLLLNARRLERERGLPDLILLAMDDVTGESLSE